MKHEGDLMCLDIVQITLFQTTDGQQFDTLKVATFHQRFIDARKEFEQLDHIPEINDQKITFDRLEVFVRRNIYYVEKLIRKINNDHFYPKGDK